MYYAAVHKYKLWFSGVARTSSLLGHSMGTLRLYKLAHEVQKLIGGVWGHPPSENLEFYSLPDRF